MYILIYRFTAKPDQVPQFLQSWREMTLLIREYEGSLGSRLHQESECVFIAYAQWPDRQTFENSGAKLPEHAQTVRKVLRESCESIETLHRLEMLDDLLIHPNVHAAQ